MPVSAVAVTEGSGKSLHTWQRSVSSVNREEQYVQLGEPALATYTAAFQNIAIANAGDHVLQIMAGASSYLRILEIAFWQETGATAAAVTRFTVQRLWSAGTGGTSVTPAPFDTADTAAATAMTLPSSKGTTGAALLTNVVSLRQAVATSGPASETPYLWTAPARGKPIIVPAGTANGIAIITVSARAGATFTGYVTFTETAWL